MFRLSIRALPWLTLLVAIGVIALLAQSPRPLSPIKGSITVNGIPASFVMLEFHFSDGTHAAALSGEDGTFVVSDTAMSNQGRFRYLPASARVVAWQLRPMDAAIPPRYRSLETTPLSVPISENKNEFTIEISVP